MSSEPADRHQAARARASADHAMLEGRSLRLTRTRLACFGALVVVAVLAYDGRLAWWWVALPVVVFVALVLRHERVHAAIDRASRSIAHHDDALARLEDRWAGHGNPGTHLQPSGHPYARDLDLFGSGSLFELLCTTRTRAGERTLADWLLQAATPERVSARHAAVEELRERLELREQLAIAGADVQAGLDPEALARWGTQAPASSPAAGRRARVLSWLAAGAFVLALAAWQRLDAPATIVVGVVVLRWLALAHLRTFVQRTDAAVERPARELEVMAELFARLEREPFEAPYSSELQRVLATGTDSAAHAVRDLQRRVQWLQMRRSAPLGPLLWFVCFGELLTLSIERWRLRHGPQLQRWFDALGELEALAALSAYAFGRPTAVWPELVDGPACLHGEGLTHPLLPARACVANDVALGEPVRALVISGSNMAGKSTYLRTLGINVVLAQAGAPVCATRLRLSPLAIGASIRVEDSLRGGASRFSAELARLQQIVALLDHDMPVLFLLDEILHGTNSDDRRQGAAAILHRLVDAGAIGMMTTHDLAIAHDVVADAPRIRNVHFAETLAGNALAFDYRMKDGIVRSSNALALMRAMGLLPPA
ncbi:MAG: DNA mismatch repair protein MutS [Deltaproteobacteria bacterium]|nr:DNA mismatch repair protein MutS [Deltaproteobacteria bacterium]MBP7292393.1 DNA mismatch repair protein MutS [Nannocystaceae bacterium]